MTALYRTYRPQSFDDVVGTGTRRPDATQRHRPEPGSPGVPLRRPTGDGQDVDGENPREGAELPRRAGPHVVPGRDVSFVRRDRERKLARRRRDGRGLAARNRRHPRDSRAGRAPAGRGALQGLHPRRGAPAHRCCLERPAQAHRGTAAAPALHLLHDRPEPGDREPFAPGARRSSSSARDSPSSSRSCGASSTEKASRCRTQRSP